MIAASWPTAPGTLSTVQVEERTGVSYRRLDYWSRLGLVTNEFPADGSGSRRCWSEADLRRVFVAEQLMAWHPSRNETKISVIAESIDYERDEVVAALPDGTVSRLEWPPGSILIDVAYARRRAAEVLDG